jgi:hypothetical protein
MGGSDPGCVHTVMPASRVRPRGADPLSKRVRAAKREPPFEGIVLVAPPTRPSAFGRNERAERGDGVRGDVAIAMGLGTSSCCLQQ